jgi:hypothetical protein
MGACCTSQREISDLRVEINKTKRAAETALPEGAQLRKEILALRNEANKTLSLIREGVDAKGADLTAHIKATEESLDECAEELKKVSCDMNAIKAYLEKLQTEVDRLHLYYKAPPPVKLDIAVAKEDHEDEVSWMAQPLRAAQPMIPVDIFGRQEELDAYHAEKKAAESKGTGSKALATPMVEMPMVASTTAATAATAATAGAESSWKDVTPAKDLTPVTAADSATDPTPATGEESRKDAYIYVNTHTHRCVRLWICVCMYICV